MSMMFRRGTIVWRAVLAVAAVAVAGDVLSAERHPATVPPTMEIEVLDPNADPSGHPAVELHPGPGGSLQVDVPPVVLVHKFYYTGERSFEAQMLPGGPTILVVNHPKTGERCYVQVQMFPGQPRVTYTKRSIEYDFGEHGMTLVFGKLGPPRVRYRSGTTWRTKAARAVHAEQWSEHAQQVAVHARQLKEETHDSLRELAVDTHGALEQVTMPIHQLLRMMPLGTAVFDPDRTARREAVLAEYEREQELAPATVPFSFEGTQATIR